MIVTWPWPVAQDPRVRMVSGPVRLNMTKQWPGHEEPRGTIHKTLTILNPSMICRFMCCQVLLFRVVNLFMFGLIKLQIYICTYFVSFHKTINLWLMVDVASAWTRAHEHDLAPGYSQWRWTLGPVPRFLDPSFQGPYGYWSCATGHGGAMPWP